MLRNVIKTNFIFTTRAVRSKVGGAVNPENGHVSDFFETTPKQYEGQKVLKKLNFDHIPIEQQATIFFPGQGAQFVGMLEKTKKQNPKALELFERASAILGYDLLKVIDDGPSTKLTQTLYCQPAMVVSSLVGYENLKLERPNITETVTSMAGFSVGEYAAAIASEMMSFEDGIQFVKRRAEAMDKCCQLTASKMVVISVKADSRLQALIETARAFATEAGEVPLCETSIYLFTGHQVLGMSECCYDFISKNHTNYNVKVIKELPVAGAFHTRLMSEAVNELKIEASKLNVNYPICNMYSNYTGALFERKKRSIRNNLLHQICGPVKWEQIQQLIYRNHEKVNGTYSFPMYYEVGPGKSLGAMWANVSKKAFKNYKHISC
uniref:PKS_AT domain-containing protein n=1 Tax=Rhabditophanes sp. KR3021 TaxID=114890 RepID=A0AC35TG77_9BILA